MKLTLSVSSGSKKVINDITVEQVSATIGRNADNSLVLEDPQRYISGHHAVIHFRTPSYFITDTSGNGLLINDSIQPLGNGNSAQLNDGDELHIGDYLISVTIVDEQQLAETQSGSKPYKPLDFSDDPFGGLETDSVQNMIDDKQLTPADWSEETNPFHSSDTENWDFVNSELKKNEMDNRLEVEQPHPVNEVFPAIHTAKNKQESNIPDDWFSPATPTKEEPIQTVQTPQNKTVNTPTDLPAQIKPFFLKENEPIEVKDSPKVSNNQALIVENFLQGAGLQNEGINESITPETFYVIGKILRTSIQGTMDVLVGRAKIKNEMHMDVTMIQSRQNNPVKFSVSAKEAMRKLLAPQDAGYLPADEAIEEAFEDICAHQISVIAGMQTALLEVLLRFDPQKLEQRLQKKSPISASIPIHKQAKLWDLFEQQYEDIEREASDNFYQLFGQAFAESYEDQIIKLKNSKK